MKTKGKKSHTGVIGFIIIFILIFSPQRSLFYKCETYADALRGIDVSYWQGNINWGEVRNSGINFAMIRDGYGTRSGGRVDRMFHTNMRNAQANGLLCGVYHYSYAMSAGEACEEADFCIDNISGYKLDYPVAFDIEDPSMKCLGRRMLTDICKSFCDRVRQRGYYPIIYTNVDWIRNFLYYEELSCYDIWLARWRAENPGYKCGIWQYSNCGRVPGIYGDVDLDIGYMDYPSIIRSLGLNGF